MALFRRPPPRGRFRHEETALQRFLRAILIGALCAGVIWGFWLNSERQMERVLERIAPQADLTGTLTPEQEELLHTYALRFFAEYGVRIQIVIQDGRLSEDKARQAGTVYLGINPNKRQVLFYAPPLVASALGEPFIRRLNQEHFVPYFSREAWPEGLAEALSMLSARLDATLRHGQSPESIPRMPGSPADSAAPPALTDPAGPGFSPLPEDSGKTGQ